jgi:hypothetical protein
MKKIYSTLFIVFLIIGCSNNSPINEIMEEDPINEIIEEEIVNLPPNNFDVEILNISHDCATINWSEAIDPDNDTVTYDVYLNQVLIIENISELSHEFIDLEELTSYSGKIIAKDTNNNQTEVVFSLQTEKYYLKYLKRYDYGEINYGIGYASGQPHKMIKTSDGNYLIIGSSVRPNGNAFQFFVSKTDYDGNELWKKFYDYDLFDYIKLCIVEYENGLLLSGENHILNIDNQGNVIWYKKIEDYGLIGHPINIKSIKNDSNNNFYLVGLRGSSEPEPGHSKEAVVLKIDFNGNLIWEKIHKISFLYSLDDMVIKSQNEIYVLGSSETNGVTPDFLVVKMNNQGDIIWQNTFGDGRYDFPKQIIIKSNNNIVFAGYSWGAYDISGGRIFEIDSEGNEIWNISTELPFIFSIAETLDGGFITTGHLKFHDSNALGIYKFSSSGIEEWKKTYLENYTYLSGRSILIEEDGGYRIAGSFSKTNYFNVGEKPELLIYKTDPEGNYE